jgi:hypothetical protein
LVVVQSQPILWGFPDGFSIGFIRSAQNSGAIFADAVEPRPLAVRRLGLLDGLVM